MKTALYYYTFLILLVLSNINTEAQPLYSNYLLNPLNNWTGGNAIFNKNDTLYFTAIGGGNNFYTDNAMLIGKLGENGEIIYQKTYQESFTQFYPGRGGFYPVGDSSYIVIGSKRTSESEGLIFQLDQNFDTIIATFFKIDTFSTIARSIVLLSNGEYIISGEHYSHISEVQSISEGVFLYKTDNSGNMLWYRTFKPDVTNLCYSVSSATDNGYVLSGYTNSKTDYSGEPLVIKTDSLGNQEWIWQNGSVYDDLQAISTISKDGNIMLTYGHATYQAPPWPIPPALTRIRVLKMDNFGNEIWSKFYGGSYLENQVWTITHLPDSTYLIGGLSWSEDTYYTRAFLLKINEQGDSLWMRYYIYEDEYGTQMNLFSHANTGPDNSILLIGCNQNFLSPAAEQSMWIMRLDSLGCDTPECNPFVGVKKPGILKEGRINLFPNPANQFIEIEVPDEFKNGTILQPLVRFYSFDGKFIKETVPDNLGSTFRCNLETLKPGAYFIQLIDRNCIIGSNKLLIIR